MLRIVLPACLTALFLAGLSGCGSSSGDEFPREAVSGTITFDNQPLKEGNIQFLPDSPGEKFATTAGATIHDGSFQIPKNEGPTPGQYHVAISSGGDNAYRPAAGEMPGVPPREIKEKIPAQYNMRTKLTAEVHQGGPNTFQFTLSTK